MNRLQFARHQRLLAAVYAWADTCDSFDAALKDAMREALDAGLDLQEAA